MYVQIFEKRSRLTKVTTLYVYMAHSYREDGKVKNEKRYIGLLRKHEVIDGVFDEKFLTRLEELFPAQYDMTLDKVREYVKPKVRIGRPITKFYRRKGEKRDSDDSELS